MQALKETIIEINGIRLCINPEDKGGLQYLNRQSYEESVSPLYPLLASSLKPKVVIDIGANYGFTGAIFGKYFSDIKLYLVEPDTRLTEYIEKNMVNNGVNNFQIISSSCGNQELEFSTFHLNPSSSQDNRVKGLDGWVSRTVPTITLDTVLKSHITENVFIKIDTQGFEVQVFEGGESFLKNSNRWFVKSEFAPYWLKSQGNNPESLLSYLTENYNVVEAPARIKFMRDDIYSLVTKPLQKSEILPFIDYVESLNKNKLGWVDIYVYPQNLDY